jgi:hypothetical protein
MKNEVLHRVKEKSNILYTVKRRKANWIGHILHENRVETRYSRKDRREWKIKKSRKQLLDVLKKGRIFWKLKEEAQDLNLLRTRFSRFCGPALRQTIDYYYYYHHHHHHHHHLLLLLRIIKFCAAAILNITLTISGICISSTFVCFFGAYWLLCPVSVMLS